MFEGCHESLFIYKYFEATEDLAFLLGSMLWTSFPDFYLKYEVVFKVGK